MACKIDTKSKRDRLAVRREPYWDKLKFGGYIGYRRTKTGGTWIARHRGENKKQRYQSLQLPPHLPCNEYDAAVAEARKWFEGLESGALRRATTVEAVAEAYLKDLSVRKGPKAVADAQGRLQRYILPSFGTKRADKLRTFNITNWFHEFIPAEGAKDGIRKAKASANRNLTTLKAVLNYAYKNGLVASPSSWARVSPFPRVNAARKAFLTKEQILALIAQTHGGFRVLVKTAALIGARYGELCALRVKDVDTDARVLHIREGKTGQRIVPLTTEMFGHLSALSKGKLPEAYLLTRDDGKPWGHSDQDELMREAARRAELPGDVVFYTLRHSFIALMIAAGMDIYHLAAITGTSIAMIEAHYGKLLKDRVREAMEKASIYSVA